MAKGVAAGGRLESLLLALQSRETRRDELRATIAASERTDASRVDRKQVEQRVTQHLQAWRALLTSHVQDARQLLREMLAGPITFTPEGKTHRFEGAVRSGACSQG